MRFSLRENLGSCPVAVALRARDGVKILSPIGGNTRRPSATPLKEGNRAVCVPKNSFSSRIHAVSVERLDPKTLTLHRGNCSALGSTRSTDEWFYDHSENSFLLHRMNSGLP